MTNIKVPISYTLRWLGIQLLSWSILVLIVLLILWAGKSALHGLFGWF